MEPPVIKVFRPFWDERELGAASDRRASGKLRSALGRLGRPDAALVPTSSGRTALELSLRVLKRIEPKRKFVAIPTYACRAIFDAVLKAQLEPVFIDCDENLNISSECFSKIADANTLAVIVAHISGCAAEVERIVETSEQLGIFVIDDRAQSPGLPVTGMAPHFAVYSFGFGKMISATAGGAAASDKFAGALLDEEKKLGSESDSAVRKRFDYVNKNPSGATSCGIPLAISSFGYNKMNPLDAAIAFHQLEKLADIMEKQRKNAETIIAALGKNKAVRFQSGNSHVYSRLTAIVEDEELRTRITNSLHENRIETEAMYMPIHKASFASRFAPAKPLGYSERIYPAAFNIPIHAGLSESDLEKICAVLKKYNR